MAEKPTAVVRFTVGDKGDVITIETYHWGTAYARNGNVHNPTKYSRWQGYLNGELVASTYSTRWEAYEAVRHVATGDFTPRPFWVVRDEMKANRI